MKFEALEAQGWHEFSGNSLPKCPHCGNDFDIADNEAWFLYSDDERHELECPSCDQTFQVNSIAVWVFSTDEQDD